MRRTAKTVVTGVFTQTANSDGIDISAYSGMADFILSATAVGGTGGACAVAIAHSDTLDNGFEALHGFEMVNGGGPSTQLISVPIDQMKKYVRAQISLGGEDPTVTLTVLVSGKGNFYA